MAELILKTWYLSVVPVLVFYKTARVGTERLRDVLAELDSVVESRRDLLVVRDAINLNMRLAALLVAELLAFLCGWALALLFLVDIDVLVVHLLPFGAASVALWLYTRRVEREFAALRVASEDPLIAETLARWLRQWREPRLRLPE